jgi:hypothetical protein
MLRDPAGGGVVLWLGMLALLPSAMAGSGVCLPPPVLLQGLRAPGLLPPMGGCTCMWAVEQGSARFESSQQSVLEVA